MESQQLNRQELYDLVWSKPLTQIACTNQISTDSLKKICVDNQIPLPKLGHWIKLEFGKEVDIIPLVPDLSLDERLIDLVEHKKEVNPYMSRISERKKEIIRLYPSESKCSERLSNPDLLIVKARDYLLSSKSKTYKIFRGVNTTSGMISIYVSKSNVLRACRFMDSFIKLMRKRGHEIDVSYSDTYVVINSQRYKIRCREKCHRQTITEGTWTRSVLVPNGKLSIKIDYHHPKEWCDTKTPLEDKLAHIVAGFELRAEDDIVKKAQWAKEREESRKLQELKDRLQAEKEWELKKIEILKDHAVQWKLTKEIREFTQEIEMQTNLATPENSDHLKWLQWAKDIEENINPLSKGLDHLIAQYNFTYKL